MLKILELGLEWFDGKGQKDRDEVVPRKRVNIFFRHGALILPYILFISVKKKNFKNTNIRPDNVLDTKFK